MSLVITESTRKLGKSALYLLLTFVTVKASRLLYRYLRSLTMSSSSSSSSATDTETIRRNRILSSKLYFDIPRSKVPLIYSSAYDISFLGIEKLHPFDSSKWGRICQFLNLDGVLDKKSIVEPLEASKEDLLVVHSKTYLDSLKSSPNVAMIVEMTQIEDQTEWRDNGSEGRLTCLCSKGRLREPCPLEKEAWQTSPWSIGRPTRAFSWIWEEADAGRHLW